MNKLINSIKLGVFFSGTYLFFELCWRMLGYMWHQNIAEVIPNLIIMPIFLFSFILHVVLGVIIMILNLPVIIIMKLFGYDVLIYEIGFLPDWGTISVVGLPILFLSLLLWFCVGFLIRFMFFAFKKR